MEEWRGMGRTNFVEVLECVVFGLGFPDVGYIVEYEGLARC
jgi:hypothetical protein